MACEFHYGTDLAMLLQVNIQPIRVVEFNTLYMGLLQLKRRKNMKKLAIQLLVIGAMIASYAMPVLAAGGGGC